MEDFVVHWCLAVAQKAIQNPPLKLQMGNFIGAVHGIKGGDSRYFTTPGAGHYAS